MSPEAPEPKPRLEVVGEGEDAASDGEGAASAAEPAESGPSRKVVWILAALLLLVSLAAVLQTRRVGELGTRVVGLESDLAAAREELAAYRGQMGQVRVLMDDLAARVEELRELVARDPGEPQPHPFEAP